VLLLKEAVAPLGATSDQLVEILNSSKLISGVSSPLSCLIKKRPKLSGILSASAASVSVLVGATAPPKVV
jgi:hypothetical protein